MLSRLLTPYSLRVTTRSYATVASNFVRIVEVGPRDGLQNEKGVIAPRTKAELVTRLGRAGASTIEAGSFVSPKWVPQMAGTEEVLRAMERKEGVSYPVLVPNDKGLDNLLALLKEHPGLTDEIAIFTATTDSFAKRNTNVTVAESLERLAKVTERAVDNGLKVRGYVSMVIDCPFEGKVSPERVRDITAQLVDMGCYEVSLGDTVGTGAHGTVEAMLNGVTSRVPVSKLAGHFHDTFGSGVSNALTAVNAGVRVIDASVAGLGGCPYSPGATGNVATEDVVWALRHSGYETGFDLDELVDTGFWISQEIGRSNVSRAANAVRARRKVEQQTRLTV